MEAEHVDSPVCEPEAPRSSALANAGMLLPGLLAAGHPAISLLARCVTLWRAHRPSAERVFARAVIPQAVAFTRATGDAARLRGAAARSRDRPSDPFWVPCDLVAFRCEKSVSILACVARVVCMPMCVRCVLPTAQTPLYTMVCVV